MKKILFPLLMLLAFQVSAQDSIVNYLDFKENKTKKNYAYFVETLVKKGNVWEHTLYHRNRKVREKGQYLKKNKKKPVGKFYRFSRTGNVQRMWNYNESNELHGPMRSWFSDGTTNYSGNYDQNGKTGIWKYYHPNGNIACKQYFQNQQLVKTVIYDTSGQKIDTDLIEFIPPKFQGEGTEKFLERIKELHNRIDFQINGFIYINFDIDINGNIRNVNIDDDIPKDLKRRLMIYFEGIAGWTPAIQMNRKIPFSYTLPLDFRVRFVDR